MICKVCGEDKKHHAHGMCRRCYNVKHWAEHRDELSQSKKEYRAEHRDEILQSGVKYRAEHGGKPASENKQCAAFLGVHVAEQVLSKVFKDVEQMPPNNKGFDFICNKGKKIDVKSTCTRTHDKQSDAWDFHIKRNQIAEYFLCLAFDNRDNLNPLHIWLIPGHIINHLKHTSIAESTLSKWDEYKLDISKTVACCDNMKETSKKTKTYGA